MEGESSTRIYWSYTFLLLEKRQAAKLNRCKIFPSITFYIYIQKVSIKAAGVDKKQFNQAWLSSAD